MTYVLIGFAIGLMMGLTGAGGAIISMPLFQLTMAITLKEATALSLITVVLGTGVNLITRLREVKWKVVFTFAMAGAIANFFALPLKILIPEFGISSLLVLIGLYSIISVLHPKETVSEENSPHFLMVITIGLFLGVVTTLTGLGGGVLLIPILLRIFGMPYEKALPTSLVSIFFISLSALFFQRESALTLITGKELSLLAIGAILSYAILKTLLRRLSGQQTLKLRQVVFTIVTVISLAIVILKTR